MCQIDHVQYIEILCYVLVTVCKVLLINYQFICRFFFFIYLVFNLLSTPEKESGNQVTTHFLIQCS